MEMMAIDLNEICKSRSSLKIPVKEFQKIATKALNEFTGIILIHNMDRLVTEKETSAPKSNDVEDMVSNVISFLRTMLKSTPTETVIIVGETSKPELLDHNLTTCFQRKIRIPVPSASERQRLIKYFCRNVSLDNVDLNAIGLKASGYVASDIKNLIAETKEIAEDRESEVHLASDLSLSQFGWLNRNPKKPSEIKLQSVDFYRAMTEVTPKLKQHGFPSVPDVTWDNLGGLLDVRTQLRSLILRPILHPEMHKKYCIKQKSGQ